MNNRALILVAVIFGLLLGMLLLRQGDLAWMALPFMAYLGLSLLHAPAAEKVFRGLRALRTVETRRERGKTLIHVRVSLHNRGEALERLSVRDELPPATRPCEGRLGRSAALLPGETMELDYAFPAVRGNFSWKTLPVVVRDPFGLFETPLALPAPAVIETAQELRRIRPFSLRAQRTLPSSGSIPARRGGSGTDFWGVREYHPGDPLRHLDWRLNARHPHRFFTKEFEQESIADIGVILDAREKTDLPKGDDSLFEHSARAAASLSEVFLRQGNRVSLCVQGNPVVNVFPGYGKVQLNRILRALAQAVPHAVGSLGNFRFLPVRMFSSRSLIVVITPLAADDWRLFPRLRALGYQVLVISPDPLDYARTASPEDRIGRFADRLARLERQLEISRIRRLWIPVIDWPVDQPLSPLVHQALFRTQIQKGLQ